MENQNHEAFSDCSESTTSATNTGANYQFAPNTPTQKQIKKKKPPRYLRNASIKLLTHPVDKNLAWSFFLSVIFAFISVITGFPTALVLLWLLGLAMGIRMVFAKCCGYRRVPRIRDVEGQRVVSSSCLRSDNFVKPPEALWLHDSTFNMHVAHCLFFLDSGFGKTKLKEIMKARVLNKSDDCGGRAFPRFLQKIVPVCSGYCWVDDDEFVIENHIVTAKKDLKTMEDLEVYVNELMTQPLNLSRPLWEIKLIRNFGKCKDTVLVIRIHQVVSDAITLILILCNYMADHQQNLKLKSRFGSHTFFINLFRSLFVAPLTFLGWVIFKRRDYNFFNRRHKPQSKVVSWSQGIKFSKVIRIKQVMRCSLNDVFVSAVSGAVRAYFTKNGIRNPPNVTLSIPVDLRPDPDEDGNLIPHMGCQFSQVNVRLPSNTEGAIPRLWDVRRRMEELKTSPDTVVMYGAMYCLLPILPEVIAQWILNIVLKKATVVLANVPGPEAMVLLGCKKLKRIVFWMSPRPEIPVVFSIISYAGTVQLSVSADQTVVQQPQLLIKEFVYELKRLSHLLAKRRIPGEHRRRSHFTEERRLAEILNPPDTELQQKLHRVQEEIHCVVMKMNVSLDDKNKDGVVKPMRVSDVKLLQRLDELKEEFSELMRELRRRKSIADGVFVDGQDEDMDGELRRPRRLTLSNPSRRASLNVTMASTSRPLSTTTSRHMFVVSTPNLQAQVDASPTSAHSKPSFLQVAQERFGRRKSDFN